jgi:hypothetical protein
MAIGAAVFLAIFFGLAGPSWELAIYRLLQDGGCAVLWLISMGGIGWIFWRFLRPEISSPAGATCVALGIGITSLAILVLGLIGWMNQWWAFGIVGTGAAIAVILLFARNRNRNLAPWVTEPAGWGWLWIAAAAVAGVVTLAAFFPPGLLWGDEPNGYDVVEYHLQVPREWYEAGRIIPLHHNVFSYFPFNVEMQYLLAMWLHGGSRGPWAGMYLAQLMHTAICGVAAWAVYGLAGGGKRGIVAGLITAAIPWTGLLAAVSYNDGGTLLFGILAIGWAIRGRGWREFLIAGAMAGFAMGTKLSVVPLLLAAPVVICAGKKYLVGCVLYLAMGLLVLSPWLIRNWQWTGNPVFPEAMSVFGKGDFSGVQAERWRQAYLPDVAYRSPAGRIRALWDQVVADWRYGYVLLPLGCAAVILTRKNQATICLAILLIVQTGFWLCFTHLQSRFMVMIIPMIALLIAQYESRGWTALCAVIAVGLACFSIAMLIGKMTRYLQTDHDKVSLIGRENLEGFRMLDTRTLKDDQSLDLVGDAGAFWYQVPMSRLHYKTVFDVDTSDPNQSIDQAWLAGMPKNAVVWRDNEELKRFARTYYGIKSEIRNPNGESKPKSE